MPFAHRAVAGTIAVLLLQPPPPRVASLTVSATGQSTFAVAGAAAIRMRVQLDGPATGAAAIVALTSSSGLVTVPARLSIEGGRSAIVFDANVRSATVPTSVTIRARVVGDSSVGALPPITDGTSNTVIVSETGGGATATLTLFPPPELRSLVVQPTTVTGGTRVTLALTAAVQPTSGQVPAPLAASLATDRPDLVQLPATIAVPTDAPGGRGSLASLRVASAEATTKSPPPGSAQAATITATLAGRSVTTTLLVAPVPPR